MIIINTYVLEIPNLRVVQSQKKYFIFDSEKNKIGDFGRFYRNTFEKIFSYTLSRRHFTNVQVYDENNNLRLIIEAKSAFFTFKGKWKITANSSKGITREWILYHITKLSLAKNFELINNSRKLTIIDRTIGIEPCFYDEENKLLAECKDKFGSKEVKVSIYDETLDIYLIAGICLLISLIS